MLVDIKPWFLPWPRILQSEKLGWPWMLNSGPFKPFKRGLIRQLQIAWFVLVRLRLALSACVAIRAFVPPAQPNAAPALRASAAAVLAASTALPAGAADEYLNYNMTGRIQVGDQPWWIAGVQFFVTVVKLVSHTKDAGLTWSFNLKFNPCMQCVTWRLKGMYLEGEFTPFMIIGYFGLTTFLTAFAFGSYLILTKLKIIWLAYSLTI